MSILAVTTWIDRRIVMHESLAHRSCLSDITHQEDMNTSERARVSHNLLKVLVDVMKVNLAAHSALFEHHETQELVPLG